MVGSTQIVGMLNEASTDCSLVVDINTRPRTLSWLMLDPRKCGLKSVSETMGSPAALVFDHERVGLASEEL